MKPSIGRIVRYKLTGNDAEAINRRRQDFARHLKAIRDTGSAFIGYIGHTGNHVSEGDVFPAMIVSTWDHASSGIMVNLQVFLDGNDTFWATSRHEGDNPGEWSWPEITPKTSVNITSSFTPEQIDELARRIQASLLTQARKSPRTGLLNPYHKDMERQIQDAVISPEEENLGR